jgi:hypothetical protein
MLFLQQCRGACRALSWHATGHRHVCGLLEEPRRYLRWLPSWLEKPAIAWFRRSIAAGIGCDSNLEVE